MRPWSDKSLKTFLYCNRCIRLIEYWWLILGFRRILNSNARKCALKVRFLKNNVLLGVSEHALFNYTYLSA